jgi:hypothetical protein
MPKILGTPAKEDTMASADPRDPIYGQPYTGTPVQDNTSRAGSLTVLDMLALKTVRITATDTDNHYTPDGSPYHE